MTQNRTASSLFALPLGALGVVYGDIGTSPLHALKEVFAHGHVPLTERKIYGVPSLVFWTLKVFVSLVLCLARHRDPDAGRRHGRLARKALRRHAPQPVGGSRLPEPTNRVVEPGSKIEI